MGFQSLRVSTLIYQGLNVLPAASSPTPTLQRGRVA